jgi:hypothetical protein
LDPLFRLFGRAADPIGGGVSFGRRAARRGAGRRWLARAPERRGHGAARRRAAGAARPVRLRDERDAHGHPDGYTDRDTDRDTDFVTDFDPDGYIDRHADGNAHCDTDSVTDFDPDGYTDRHADPNTHARAERSGCRLGRRLRRPDDTPRRR